LNRLQQAFPFQEIGQIKPARNDDGTVMTELLKSTTGRCKKLHAYGEGPFCRFKIQARHEAGVYAILVDGQLQYIGRTLDLATRFNQGYGRISPRNIYTGGQPTNCRINHLIFQTVQDGKAVTLNFLPTADYVQIESALISDCNPAWNLAGVAD